MRVLIINDYFEGGGAEGVFRLTADLLQGANFEVYTYIGSKSPQAPRTIFQYLFGLKSRNGLIKLLMEVRPDVIHVHNYYHILSSSIFTSIAKYKKLNQKCRIVFTAHDFHIISPSSNLLYYKNNVIKRVGLPYKSSIWFFLRIDTRGISYSLSKKIAWLIEWYLVKPLGVIDVIISPSIFLGAVFIDKGVKNRISYIRNPLPSIDVFNKQKYHIKNKNSLRFVFCGRLSYEKGLGAFFDFLKLAHIEINIDVFGDGELRESLMQVSQSDNIKVVFHGSIANEILIQQLRSYDVALIPSIGYENAPLFIPEAASAGLIIWGSANGGIKEICEMVKVPHFLYNSEDLEDFIRSYNNIKSFVQMNIEWEPDLNEFLPATYLSKLSKVYAGD